MATQQAPGPAGLDDRVPFLARLEPREREELLALGSEMRFTARQALLREREPSSHVLILFTGWTKVTASAANGYEALLALRGPGDIVGESGAITGRSRAAHVTALEDVRAVALPQPAFVAMLRTSPAVSMALLALVSDRTRAADRRRLEFGSLPVRERLAALLLDLARVHGERTPEGIEIRVPLSKQELAGFVGASREMIQRLLRELRDREAVSTGRRSILLHRPDVLRQIAGRGVAGQL
ncbi:MULTISPECIES: Crp/Fnr family transcriptional regulator [unclassified Streptomyces]|uniref:Crp/Fnr family transcriptional regulator n=1 Tax=unclassified Streptomyces TaxID=2593676 RepID=UPI0010114ABE|nr:Crp/Fnr family transcriptional regulator [Streptomyces sp. GZWMJZ-114]